MVENGWESFTLDRELRLAEASANTLALWGKSAGDIRGRKLVEVFPFVDGNEVHKTLIRALDTNETQRIRARSVSLGEPVEVVIRPLPDGLHVGFLAIRG